MYIFTLGLYAVTLSNISKVFFVKTVFDSLLATFENITYTIIIT